MSRFGRKGLPLSYVFGQSFDHLMASIFGYFFAVWWTLLVMTSSEAHVGTFFNFVLRLELAMDIPLVYR
jgi:cellulose synthase/poly-beta-1,6-N-acetylglucosamine synthase-like glycosyltransferase